MDEKTAVRQPDDRHSRTKFDAGEAMGPLRYP
jgi:hypothetical protein